MNSKINFTMDHQQVEAYLPEYINGRLSSDLQHKIQEHIGTCGDCLQLQLQELDVQHYLSMEPTDIEELISTKHSAQQLEKTLERIEQSEEGYFKSKYRQGNNHNASKQGSRIKFINWSTALSAAAASLAGVVIFNSYWISTAIVDDSNSAGALYQTRTESTLTPQGYSYESNRPGDIASTKVNYNIIFQPTVTETNLRQLLQLLDAQLISGPTKLGIYTISTHLNTVDEETILAFLQSQPEILFAEKGVHNVR